MSVEFFPRHAQPFTVEQAMLLEVEMLAAATEIARLENSLVHLRKTQQELSDFLESDPEADDDGEILKAKKENDQVIASQEERIVLIKVALMNKIGPGGLEHYGYGLPKTSSSQDPAADTTVPTTGQLQPPQPLSNGGDEADVSDDGVYL